jgi:hypothetical protein
MKLVDVTPEDSIVPVYVEDLTAREQRKRDAEQAERLAQAQAQQAELEAKESARVSGMNKLKALGLTEEEAKALTNGS